MTSIFRDEFLTLMPPNVRRNAELEAGGQLATLC